jgi:hypothetical protein
MNRPRPHPPEGRIAQALGGGLRGLEPPTGLRAKLLATASNESDLRQERWTSRALPGWISASTARRLRERRISMQGLKHGYIAAALNYRLSW